MYWMISPSSHSHYPCGVTDYSQISREILDNSHNSKFSLEVYKQHTQLTAIWSRTKYLTIVFGKIGIINWIVCIAKAINKKNLVD